MRRGMMEVLAGEGALTGRGYKRLWNSIIADVYEGITEAGIKRQLYSFLQCYDITPDERAECLRLLQLAETALTEDQRQQILSYLQAE